MLMTGIDNTFKVKFVAEDKTKEFKKGDILNAFLPPDDSSGKWYGITNRWGENYGYPASWFEIVEE